MQSDQHLCCSLQRYVSISEISRLKLVSVAEQAGLSLTWSETSKTGFLVTRLIYRGELTGMVLDITQLSVGYYTAKYWILHS